MIKTIFFDLDGVLTTDRSITVTVSNYFAVKLGIGFQELLDYIEKFDEEIDKGKMSNVCKSACEELGIAFNTNWLQEAYLNTPIDDKMLQYAMKLKSKYSIGIITDNSIERVNTVFEKNNWANIFDVIIISEEVKNTKKGTKIFEIAAQRANVSPEECIFIDNNQENVASAKKAGLAGVHFDDQKRDYEKLFKVIDEIINKFEIEY